MVQEQLSDSIATSEEVRLQLVGDPGVGKTSLIYSLVRDEFESNVPPEMAPITVPPEVTLENTPLHISDYSDWAKTDDELIEVIKDSNVICLVYTAGDQISLDRVVSHWIPLIRSCNSKSSYKPIILAANKIDLVEEVETQLEQVMTIVQNFMEVEAVIEVSALTQKNVLELFSAAQRAVLYPMKPLFDCQMRALTKKCRNALLEIFDQCDLDGDGLLSDDELNLFQENLFGTPLQRDALDDLKSVIKQSTMDGIEYDGITKTGFLFLHTLSIDKGRHDFTWQVLRKFNYDNAINFNGDVSQTSYGQSEDRFLNCSYASSQGSSSRNGYKVESENSEVDNNYLNDLDLSWIRERSGLVKTGLGITLATLVSILALRYIVRSGSRTSA